MSRQHDFDFILGTVEEIILNGMDAVREPMHVFLGHVMQVD